MLGFRIQILRARILLLGRVFYFVFMRCAGFKEYLALYLLTGDRLLAPRLRCGMNTSKAQET